jgi:hypothetical protein
MTDDNHRPAIPPDQAMITWRELAPGQVIYRWTDNRRSGTVGVPLPCHDAQEITVDCSATDVIALCRTCSTTFGLTIHDDNDGGYTAEFTVAYRPFLLSRARRKR